MQPRTILALLLLFSISLPLPMAEAQTTLSSEQNKNDEVVKITTNLVQIDAVVTKDGKPVPNLKAEDFEIYEDGRKQAITSFAYISNLTGVPVSASSATAGKGRAEVPTEPIQRDVARRTVAIVIDDLGLSAQSMSQVRRQVRQFITEELQPNDLVAIIRTGGEMGALQQFTNDRRLLNRAIDLLRWNACSRGGVSVLPRAEDLTIGSGCGGLTILQTLKALRFILDSMGQLPGRKSLILMSDDIPVRAREHGSEGAESVLVGGDVRNYGDWLQKLTETAIRSSVVIYSVDTQGLQVTGITAADSVNARSILANGGGVGSVSERSARLSSLEASRSRVLEERREGGSRIAQRTGGFQVRNSNGFQLDRILEDQSGYYLLGYRPTEETFNRKFHNIKAKVKRSGMTLRTRYGFFGVTEEEANGGRPTIKDQTTLALLSPFGAQEIEVYQNSFFANPKADGSVIRSFVYLNPAHLTFVPANGRRETPLEIHGVIFGDNGAVIEKVKHDIVLSLGDSEYEQAIRDGLPDAVRLRFDMTVKKPGSYQVRIAVRDRTSSKIGSAGQFVAVPNLNDKRVALSGIVLRSAGETAAPALLMANPPARRFPVNSELRFAFLLYNAPINPATQLPNVTTEIKLFRDGKSIGPAVEMPIDVKNQADLSRLFVNGTVQLDPTLEPGNYYLQVVVTDKPAKDKQAPITQWIDFEVVK